MSGNRDFDSDALMRRLEEEFVFVSKPCRICFSASFNLSLCKRRHSGEPSTGDRSWSLCTEAKGAEPGGCGITGDEMDWFSGSVS
mmetsp:Transcript_3911/g.5159  ORF Transcript_3911/g.5159 Transcript_3911/m.5159 type:complete len:85 (+) Transcript_3911:1874-2128(+)